MAQCENCKVKFHDFYSSNIYTWCTNCGNYGIHAAVKRALVEECVEPKDTLLCFDIGCHGNGSDKIGGYKVHGLHGRVIPFACGASVANEDIHVLAFGGDGGTLGEGINHLIHAIRSNYNITFILHNNLNYGLTLGQASPTSRRNMRLNSSPGGVSVDPLHVVRLVLSLNPTFVARSFSGDVKHMTGVIQAGLKHKGFSFIEIFQSCPTYNKETPHEWYQKRVFDVSELEDYDRTDIRQALEISEDLLEKVAMGVLYQETNSPDFNSSQSNRADITSELVDEVKNYEIEDLLKNFQ